jgi:Leucine-rich repeat (LRR) protein
MQRGGVGSSVFPKSGTIFRTNSKTVEKITNEVVSLRESLASASNGSNGAKDASDSALRAQLKMEKQLDDLISELNRFSSIVVEDKKNATTLYYFQLSIFPNLKKLHLQMVPPTTVVDFYLLRDTLEVLEITNAGISKLYKVFLGPTDLQGGDQQQDTGGKPLASASSSAASSPRYASIGAHTPYPSPAPSTSSYPFYSPSSPTRNNAGAVNASESPRKCSLLKQLKPMIMSKEITYEIPEHTQWRYLKQVRIANCGVARLDQSFHFMPNIEYLDVSFNEITHIIHLQVWKGELDGQGIHVYIFVGCVQDCFRLSTLDVSYNRIRVLSNIGES